MTNRWKGLCWGIVSLLLIPWAVNDLIANTGIGKVGEVALDRAPDFALKDIQGRTFKLSENRGRPVLLVFGATWCPYCVEEIPRLKKMFANYTPKGVAIVSIDIQESQAKVARFAGNHKLPYRVLLDETASVAKNYGVRGVPSFVLVDKRGVIACRQCPSVEPLLDNMLKKK